jgi:dephospho-CoA kinase
MLKIGITGGIGSGKSYVCEVFKHLGIPVYSADNAAKVLYTKSSAVKSKIIDLFGEEVYSHEGINRSKLASKVFGNPDLLKRLNSIIHPAVEADFNDWCQTYTDQKYILKEAAILFESEVTNCSIRLLLLQRLNY